MKTDQQQTHSLQRLQLLEQSLTILEKELAWRQRNERFSFYAPNGKIEEFLKIIGKGDTMVGVLSAGNGLGKTAFVVNLIANLIWGPQSEYFNQPIIKDWKYPKRIRYITDPKLVEEIGPFQSEVEKFWPKGRYTVQKAGKSYFSQYKAKNWVVDVMTYDQEIRQFEGGTMGLIIFDEPPPRDIWNACVARLRLGGLLLCVMTPLTHAAWFFDEVVPRHAEHTVYAQIEDACIEHGTRGHLKHDAIQNMVGEMPPDEVEARAYGKALYLAGVVFKNFDERIHVLKEPMLPPLGSTVYNVVDPHADKPFFAIWAYPHRNGDLYIIDEHPNEDFFKMHNCQWTIKDYQKMYEQKEKGFRIKRVIDRHYADAVTAANKKTLRQELEEIGMYYEASYSASEEIDTGVLEVRKKLQYDPTRKMDNVNRPTLYINPHCLNTIKAFRYWSYDRDKGKYKDEYKDPMDVVRYLVMCEPHQSDPMPVPQYKKLYG